MNPVRAKGPEGRARYLSRLRCPTGSVPEVRPVSCVGEGVYDNFVELYEVSCGDYEAALACMASNAFVGKIVLKL